ncbi:hypothetical protein [Burkholderia gladioli]|uniref:hypothetical protein n=1 Tax=Burkholderia gladioli TaxID=28095 RepID=UPI000D004EB0|nr:hypothetical protein [Burkholderia gladioli]PRE82368.1 hypothetical protein C6Q13_20170 [Burkholderia gladioli]
MTVISILGERDVGDLFARKLGRPMTYLGLHEKRHLFIFRDPPQDYLAFRTDELWMIERVRPEAAPIRTEQDGGFS